MLSSMLVSPFPPSFLASYSLSTSSLGCNALCMVISFLVLWYIIIIIIIISQCISVCLYLSQYLSIYLSIFATSNPPVTLLPSCLTDNKKSVGRTRTGGLRENSNETWWYLKRQNNLVTGIGTSKNLNYKAEHPHYYWITILTNNRFILDGLDEKKTFQVFLFFK